MSPNFYTRRAAMHMLANGSATVAEVATLAGVSRQAVWQWCKQEKINATKIRRTRLVLDWKIAKQEANRADI